MSIHYIVGDATYPKEPGNKIITHICNDIGKWGKGFVLAVSKRWALPEQEFYKLYQSGNCHLGVVQLVKVESDIWVANMVAQEDIVAKNGVAPIRYETLAQCLQEVSLHAKHLGASVHMPRIGCGLAGGNWDKVEPLVVAAFPGIEVVVYDRPKKR